MVAVLTVVLALILVALIYVVKGLSSVSLVLSEIRDTHRKELFRTRWKLAGRLSDIGFLLDPYNRRKRIEYHKRREEEGAKEVALLEEWPKASPERQKEIEDQRERNRQARKKYTDDEMDIESRVEREYLEREYPRPPAA